MDKASLQEKFPHLKPLSGAPPMFRLNGCGLAMYGSRDFDAETKTYVKTYCLCFVFIPVVPICAYRVADAENGGWYFVGREPLSTLAKSVNLLLLAGLLFAVVQSAWMAHVESPEYRTSLKMTEAQGLEESGQLLQA